MAIEKTLSHYFPELKPENPEFTQISSKVKDDIEAILLKYPTLENNAEALQPHITESIAHHTQNMQIENSLNRYTKNLSREERDVLKEQIIKELKTLREQGMSLVNHPKTRETMIALFIKKLCPKQKLNPAIEPVIENINKLKVELTKKIKELEKIDPATAKKLNDLLQKILMSFKDKMKNDEAPTDELKILLNMVMLSDRPKTLAELPLEDITKIITYGSKNGLYTIVPRNDVDMPNNLIVFALTPLANEKFDPEKPLSSSMNPFDVSKGPLPKE